jgi:hypothetical protein
MTALLDFNHVAQSDAALVRRKPDLLNEHG